jgi:hypothetical protein
VAYRLTPEHHRKVREGASRADFLALLIEKYADDQRQLKLPTGKGS